MCVLPVPPLRAWPTWEDAVALWREAPTSTELYYFPTTATATDNSSWAPEKQEAHTVYGTPFTSTPETLLNDVLRREGEVDAAGWADAERTNTTHYLLHRLAGERHALQQLRVALIQSLAQPAHARICLMHAHRRV